MDQRYIIYILIIHFLADFCLQTPKQAEMKSTDKIQLAYHVLTYSLIWFFASYVFFGSWFLALIFSVITYTCHYMTDYLTSRIGKPYWEAKDYHTGFVVVGADQVAHYIQLILTFQFILEGKIVLGY
jgi:uncharacterized membrane protein YjjP (DUF1212 family)